MVKIGGPPPLPSSPFPTRRPSAADEPADVYVPMGVSKRGERADVRYWAPEARKVFLVVGEQRSELAQKGEFWVGQGDWKNWEGKTYAFEQHLSDGSTVLKTDPYARQLMGQRRGIDEQYFDPTTGREVHKFTPGAQKFIRFEVQQSANARPTLELGDGRSIEMKRAGKDAWTAALPAEEVMGQRYRFSGVGEVHNEPWDNTVRNVNDQRFGIVRTNAEFAWKHPKPELNPKKGVIYQLHVGSFMGQDGNARRSTFKDVIERLDYFKELGVTHLELLPTGPFEGQRDWGYIGSNSMAVAEQYGFVDDDGRWVCGAEALMRFVDEAHGKGLGVIGDVVYNHFGGDFNPVAGKPWMSDKTTAWGQMPDFERQPVRQFVLDHAMAQLDEFRFDGLRFDFTHPIHENHEPGWTLLRELTGKIRARHPHAFLAAEEFPNHPIVTTSVEAGGAGFDAMWNTEFQHRLVHDHSNPSLMQEAVAGGHTRIDKFMQHLVEHPGFTSNANSVTVISNHDEVGNADRTLNVAKGDRQLARTAFGVGMLSPGRAIFFQGDETLSTNRFKWGTPSTWDTDAPDRQHLAFCKAAIALRNGSPDFDVDGEARRVYTHELDSVFAFSRGDHVVIASLNENPLRDYKLPLDGKWELVLSSDDPEYGGNGVGKGVLTDATVDLAPRAMLVYRKAG